MAGKGGNKTPLAPGVTAWQAVVSKPALFSKFNPDAYAHALNEQRIFNANAGYEDHPLSIRQFRAEVLALSDDGTSALVRCKGDTSDIWVPLEIAGVIVGDRVVVDFRDEGGVAVVLIVQ
jgi:hypothetical protein